MSGKGLRKRYNPLKTHRKISQIQANTAMKPLAIVYSTEEKACRLVHRKTHKQLDVTPDLYILLTQMEYRWSVYMAVFLRKPGGEIAMVGEVVQSKEYYRQADLSDFLNAQHMRILEGVNPLLVVGIGWVALTENVPADTWDIADTFKMFESLEAIGTEPVKFIKQQSMLHKLAG